MAGDDGAAGGTPSGGVLTVAINFTGGTAAGGRNPIPVVGQLLVGVSELERQLRHSVPADPDLGEFSLTPTVLAAGEPEHPDVVPSVATVVLDMRTVPATPQRGLLQLLTTLAEQIAGEAGVDCAVEIIAQRPAGRNQ